MSDLDLLERFIRLETKFLEHCADELQHGNKYHEHLLDHEEHLAHHAKLDKPKEQRAGERRGAERRTGSDGPPTEGERRAG